MGYGLHTYSDIIGIKLVITDISQITIHKPLKDQPVQPLVYKKNSMRYAVFQ